MSRFPSPVRGAMVDSPPTYTSEHDYVTYEAYSNLSYFSRALPPVPRDCPTPLGVVGKSGCLWPHLLLSNACVIVF